MKNIFLLLCLTVLVHPMFSQEADEVQLNVHYLARFQLFYEDSGKLFEDEKVLDIRKRSSSFYSLWNTRRDEIKDSIRSRGGSYSDVMNALEKSNYPLSKQNYAIYKNYPQKGILTYTDKLYKQFRYKETMETPVWRMEPGDTLIAGYPCKKARTLFREKEWTVWFTLHIPISDGPWKLHGLPGLILKANDVQGYFSFDCIEIKNKKSQKVPLPKGKFIECSRQKLEEMHRLNAKDPHQYLEQFGISRTTACDANGKPIVYKEKHAIFLEK